jgi:hypothetical protein
VLAQPWIENSGHRDESLVDRAFIRKIAGFGGSNLAVLWVQTMSCSPPSEP